MGFLDGITKGASGAALRGMDDIRALAVKRFTEQHRAKARAKRDVYAPVRAAQTEFYAEQGRQADRANAGPARQWHLQALADKIAKHANVGKVRVEVAPITDAIEEKAGKSGSSYVPAAWANQRDRVIRMNADQFDPSNNDSPLTARYNEDRQRAILAHEMGHEMQPQLVGNYARARKYLEAMGTPMDPRSPILRKSLAGRAEMNRAGPVRRDAYGMPVEGLGGIHSAPNEQYAMLVAQALGENVGIASRKKLLELARKRLIPKPTSGYANLPIMPRGAAY